MSSTIKFVFVAVIAALIGGTGTFFVLGMDKNQVENTILMANESKFVGAGEYNCKKSGGTFNDENCTCPIAEEIGQTQETIYDKKTGYCQTDVGGPGGDAFAASVGLPYGNYQFIMNIIVNTCEKSGGSMSGAACICPEKKNYDKSSGLCKYTQQ
jgi:hypothetical protein